MKIGMTEILLILVVALFVAGPDKLPYYAKKFGESLRSIRDISSEATKEIRENVVEPLNEAQKPLREAMEPVTEMTKEVNDNVREIKKSFTDLSKPTKSEPVKAKTDDFADAQPSVPAAERNAGSPTANNSAEVSPGVPAADTESAAEADASALAV